jgi:hypothetical protein
MNWFKLRYLTNLIDEIKGRSRSHWSRNRSQIGYSWRLRHLLADTRNRMPIVNRFKIILEQASLIFLESLHGMG